MKYFFLTISAVTIALFFQNCGDIKIAPLEGSMAQLPSQSTHLSGEICPLIGGDIGTSAKTIFIVDMSLSNLGRAQGTRASYGGYIWELIMDEGTDIEGKRFDFIDSMVQSLSINPNMSFSIMGFHNSAEFFSLYEPSCHSPFVSADQAIQSNNYLRGLHDYDKTHPVQITGGGTSPYNMKETSYKAALECLRAKIQFEINSGSENQMSLYNIIFLTDGKPSDTNAGVSDYVNMISQIRFDSEDYVAGLKMFTVYYGSSGELYQAKQVLDQMLQPISPGTSTMVSSDFDSIFNQIKGNFESSAKVSYKISNLNAINLTALPIKGSLAVDSNMDGIPDDEQSPSELQNGIRDIIDSFSEFNKDHDLIPSFLEKIRGLNPLLADNDFDLDGDGLSNYKEYSQGRDVSSSERAYPTALKNIISTTLEKSVRTCENNTQIYIPQINNIPTIEINRSYVDPRPGLLDFSHGRNENLILITYIAESINGRNRDRYLFGFLVRTEVGRPTNIQFDASHFVNLGAL